MNAVHSSTAASFAHSLSFWSLMYCVVIRPTDLSRPAGFSVRHDAGTFTYEFRTTAPESADESLVFTRSSADDEFTTEWVESTPIEGASSASSVAGCDQYPKWSGFLVTGLFDELTDLVGPGESQEFNERLWQVEPARLQSLLKSFVRTINLANVDRSHATLPAGCSEDSASGAPVFVQRRCMDGLLAFKPGFNCAIRQDDPTNTIVIGAAAGDGAGQPCEEVPLYAGETAQAPSPFLSGGPGCGQVIKTINGKGGSNLQLIGGAGFQVSTDPNDPHTLLITADFNSFASCLVATPDEAENPSNSSEEAE